MASSNLTSCPIVIAVAKTADLILMMLDATKGLRQRELLEAELEAVGIRINTHKPNIYFKVKKGGGISFNATCKLTYLNERMVYQVCIWHIIVTVSTLDDPTFICATSRFCMIIRYAQPLPIPPAVVSLIKSTTDT